MTTVCHDFSTSDFELMLLVWSLAETFVDCSLEFSWFSPSSFWALFPVEDVEQSVFESLFWPTHPSAVCVSARVSVSVSVCELALLSGLACAPFLWGRTAQNDCSQSLVSVYFNSMSNTEKRQKNMTVGEILHCSVHHIPRILLHSKINCFERMYWIKHKKTMYACETTMNLYTVI